jgi:hypothetical protein
LRSVVAPLPFLPAMAISGLRESREREGTAGDLPDRGLDPVEDNLETIAIWTEGEQGGRNKEREGGQKQEARSRKVKT